MTSVTISMNRHAIVDLVLYGQEDDVEGLFRRLNGAMQRLKLPFTGRRGFRRPPKGVGAHPSLGDVQGWLDSVKRTRRYKDEMTFIANLYATCRGRVRPELLEELEG